MDSFSIKALSVFIVVLAIFLMPFGAGAVDFDNAGFRKNVPQALKEKFGVCDEFLDVKWVDKSKSIGLLKADVYENGSKRGPHFLIVHLEKPGSKAFAVRGNGIFYEIPENSYMSSDFEKFLRGAQYRFINKNVFLTVKKGKKFERYPQDPLPFESLFPHQIDFPNKSFSSFSRTVCVTYPDEKQAFVVEAKKPFIKAPMDENSKQALDVVTGYAKEKCVETGLARDKGGCNLNFLKDSYALDVNGDGKDDYILLITDQAAGKGKSKRYLLLSGKEGYAAKDISGCLGFDRFFYGYVFEGSFRPGRCVR